MAWFVAALLVVAVLILALLVRLSIQLDGFRRAFIASMGDDGQIYLRTLAQRAKGEPYR